ncbi:MAG: hypothetical protein KatS3mg016_1365 [Fimbriimonadales bacterium]|nr:MAG: hypothetical protein KatS3mg016_1365 [Fimbriimonadales bacterium]
MWDPNHPLFTPIWLQEWQAWLPEYAKEAWEPDPLFSPKDGLWQTPWRPQPPSRCIPQWSPPRRYPPVDWTPLPPEDEAIYLGSGTAAVDGAGSVCAVPTESPLLAATGQTGFHIPAPATSFGHGGWTHLTSPTPGGTWLAQLYSWDRIQIVRVQSRGQGRPIEDNRASSPAEPVDEYILYDASGNASRFAYRNGQFIPAFGVYAQLIRSGDTFVVFGGSPHAIHEKGAWRYLFTGMSRLDTSDQPWGRGAKAVVLAIRDPLGNTWRRVNLPDTPQGAICWQAPNLTFMRFDPDGRIYYSENTNPPQWQLLGRLYPVVLGSGRPTNETVQVEWYEPNSPSIAFQWWAGVTGSGSEPNTSLSAVRLEVGVSANNQFISQVRQQWRFARELNDKEERLYRYLYGESPNHLGRLFEEQIGFQKRSTIEHRYLSGSGAETLLNREDFPTRAAVSLTHQWDSQDNRFTDVITTRPKLHAREGDLAPDLIAREKEVVRLSALNGKPVSRAYYTFENDREPTWTEEYQYGYVANPNALTGYRDRQGSWYYWNYTEREALSWSPERPALETVLVNALDPTGVEVTLHYGETHRDVGFGNSANPPLLPSSVQLGDDTNRRWRFQYTWDPSLTRTAPNGLLTGFAEPGRNWWQFFYTPAAFRQPFQLYQVLDPTGRVVKIANWDTLGRPTRIETYPNASGSGGWRWDNPLYQEVEYTNFGQVKKVRWGYQDAYQEAQYVWNGLQLEQFIDPRGREVRFEYVPDSGELWKIWIGNQLYAQLGYDGYGRLGRVAGGNNVGVNYEYGYRDELIGIKHDGDANPEKFFYSSCCGQVSRWQRADGTNLYFDYTPNGWLQEVYLRPSPLERQRLAYYEYDSAGRLTLAQDAITNTVFTYDTLDADRTGWLENSVVQFNNGATYRFDYAYYPSGDIQSVRLSRGNATLSTQSFTYDDAGRLTTQSYYRPLLGGSVQLSVSYEYDGAGRPIKQTVQIDNDKLETHIAYADHQSVGSVWWFNTYLNNRPVGTFRYEYYPDGTVKSVDENQDTRPDWQWDYYPDGSLAYEQSSRIGGQRSYTYDAGGNLMRLPTVAGTPSYQYNQLRSVGGWTFSYTPNGERASEANNPVSGYAGNWNYVYDVWGNLTQVYRNGQLVYEARYDAFGNRVWAKVGTEERYYLYEGDTLAAELDANGNLIAEYVWGLLGPVARVSSGGAVQLYVLDGLGHVRALVGRVNNTWQVMDTYVYDSWGNLIARTGTTQQPFTWNGAYGYEYIPATGLYHVGAREYDPRTGRWLQRDPIDAASGDPNLYRYAGNDPINGVDPEGEQSWIKSLIDLLRRLFSRPPAPRKPTVAPQKPPRATDKAQGTLADKAPQKQNPTPRDIKQQKQQPGSKNKPGTSEKRSSPKGGWKAKAKCSLASGCEETAGHHVIPQQVRKELQNAGIGINIDDYIIELDESVHRRIHSQGWNRDWLDFVNDPTVELTEDAILDFVKEMLEKYGLKGGIPCLFGSKKP